MKQEEADMRLHVEAKSQQEIGYIPDWIKLHFVKNGVSMELTFDVQGSINCAEKSLNCIVKGELIPWVLVNCTTGEELDLYKNEELQKEYENKVPELLALASGIVVGIYPTNTEDKTFELCQMDCCGLGTGFYEQYNEETKDFTGVNFKFHTELNI